MLVEYFARCVPVRIGPALMAPLSRLIGCESGYRRMVDHFGIFPQESFLGLGHALGPPQVQKLIAGRRSPVGSLRRVLALHVLGNPQGINLPLERKRCIIGLRCFCDGDIDGAIFARNMSAHADRGFGPFAVDFNFRLGILRWDIWSVCCFQSSHLILSPELNACSGFNFGLLGVFRH